MIKMINIFVLVLLINPLVLCAQDTEKSFEQATEAVNQKLEKSVYELNELREQAATEKIPLSRKLSDLENELIQVRLEYQQTSRLLDSRTLDLSNLHSEIKSRKDEASYLSNLLGEYTRNFESRLHIVELQRYHQVLEEARLAPENTNLTEQEIYDVQAGVLAVSLERLNGALGGTKFDGTATDSSGSIHHGTFVLIGPAAFFKSDDGKNLGTAEQRIGSLAPTVISFANPVDSEALSKVIADSVGQLPLDPTLGNAHKIAETKETLWEHIKRGGPVMYPILALAGAALLVVLFKWLGMLFVINPSHKRINCLLDAVANHKEDEVRKLVKAMKGPVGKMLAVGVEHINEPRELIEEVMYEKILSTKLKLDRFLPFVAISASAAPLLGLLGTVTGIIATFKMITVFGSGDVKSLSGGISEALITTEYGLIVAIPSLLFHAFLSRKARGIINQMEKTGVAFINQISKTPYYKKDDSDDSEKLTVSNLQNILQNFNNQSNTAGQNQTNGYPKNSAAGLMNKQMVSIERTSTVVQTIKKIRESRISNDIDTVFVVDENGKYAGHVLIHQLLTMPEDASIESLTDSNELFVRVGTGIDELRNTFIKHNCTSLPVLDNDDCLVGQISRNRNKK